MNIKTHVQIILPLLVTLAIVAVFVPGTFAYTEEDEQAPTHPIQLQPLIIKTCAIGILI